MSLLKLEDSKKWINAFVVVCCLVVAYLMNKIFLFAGDWLELESKVDHYATLAQLVGFGVGLITFIVLLKVKKIQSHLGEVFAELVKVAWPDKDSTTKLTIGMLIALTIVSSFFLFADFIFQKILELIY